MTFKYLLNFLEKLQKNNNKEWMDEHRKDYQSVRDFYIDWLDELNLKLAIIDSEYTDTPGKKAINRINNNLMFHPDKPVYKDNFGAGLDQETKQGDYFIHIGVNECFIGGGYWHPSSKLLKSIREGIDYDGEKFRKIIEKKSFVNMFGGLIDGAKLKTSPKGYSQDHEHIDLLRRKSFAAGRNFTEKEVIASNFQEVVIETYKELLPFRRYLNNAARV